MCKNWVVFAFIFLVLLSGVSSASATPPAKIVSGVVSNIVSALVKWLWSVKSNTKKDTDGHAVETVFDGSKLGIEPYSVELSPSGELLVLDSQNSNIYKIQTPLSRCKLVFAIIGFENILELYFGKMYTQDSRPKLIAGSSEGYSGHVDGRLREARMNHPKGLTVDDQGNIYIADTMNMAIRKISDGGITTIAGGKWAHGGGHVDGPSEDAKFSNDFDVVYIGSSCSLFVIDRGNQAILEIQLHDEDCSYQYDGCFHLGIAALAAAAFFGYMLAFLQRSVQALFSSNDEQDGRREAVVIKAVDFGDPRSNHHNIRPRFNYVGYPHGY
ncbi:hypothetical protein GH714_041499 [Hevea brasiliensis]|uniref:SMP-30/Gluconolactonase/LRE-like region domain-containing protein n=1 Tax=Hevea brasiliensis TaxID=3981 RepID=A0A6A6MW22_HEVBR|nr:hypothetical protein GH714_041499 [Hevea brasiliensis]